MGRRRRTAAVLGTAAVMMSAAAAYGALTLTGSTAAAPAAAQHHARHQAHHHAHHHAHHRAQPSAPADPTPSPAQPSQAAEPAVAAHPDAGPALYSPGDDGPEVREIQARLRQIAWFFGDVTGRYGPPTRQAVAGFQAKRGIPVTGRVDQRTLDLLEAMTTEPTSDELANRKPDPADGAALDPRCTTGRALCIDKSSSSLRWVVDGKVLMSLDVRFGASYSPTREGLFHVYLKDRDHVSHLYGSSMPLSMFFSGGQAVHYSSDFAARGYSGASHGCVNVRDYSALASLFDQVRVGDKVVVYWS